MDKRTHKRLMHLARRTGSPVIVTDQEGGEPAVLMSLDTYESLLDGLFLERPVQRRQEESQSSTPSKEGQGTADIDEVVAQETDQDMPFVGEEFVEDEITIEEVPFDPPMPESTKQEGVPVDQDDGGEEQFYLEPIE